MTYSRKELCGVATATAETFGGQIMNLVEAQNDAITKLDEGRPEDARAILVHSLMVLRGQWRDRLPLATPDLDRAAL